VKVAIVHDWLTGMRGGERVLEMFCRLFPEADLYTLFYFPEEISETIRSHSVTVSYLQHIPGSRQHYRKLLPLFPAAVESFDLKAYDLVISTSHAVAKGAIPGKDAVSICYCHTPMRYIWAMFDTYFPQEYSILSVRSAARLFKHYLASWDRSTTDRVHHFIANSRYVAERIKTVYQRSATVIHPPVNTHLFTPNGDQQEDYFLIVSALAPYKRVDLAIDAFNKMGKRLIIIGSGTERKRLESMSGSTIEFKGFIKQDHQVLSYYQNCRALIFPGVEDFGLTPLEAQACGRPVIAYGEGGVLESVIEGISGHFFHEQSVDALMEAVYDFESMIFDPGLLRQRALEYGTVLMQEKLKRFLNRIPELKHLSFTDSSKDQQCFDVTINS
jgi:glycosyltransferase involved in cell wall biosynthesis